jgi:hypothetical protein
MGMRVEGSRVERAVYMLVSRYQREDGEQPMVRWYLGLKGRKDRGSVELQSKSGRGSIGGYPVGFDLVLSSS